MNDILMVDAGPRPKIEVYQGRLHYIACDHPDELERKWLREIADFLRRLSPEAVEAALKSDG